MPYPRPTSAQLRRAACRTVPDLLAPGLKVLFCGINPGLYSAAVGHHFARPGNRFWPALHAAGFTPRLLDASEERELLELRLGITNIVGRATPSANDLSTDELRRGGRRLRERRDGSIPVSSPYWGSGRIDKPSQTGSQNSAANRSRWRARSSGCCRTPAA